ncbi:MAG: thiol-activated cytolysin family protein [Cyclobacteriaceae bacterium]
MNKLSSVTILLLFCCTASVFFGCNREENDFDRKINAAAINDFLDTIPVFPAPQPASKTEGEISYSEDQTSDGYDMLCERQQFEQTFVLDNLTLNAFDNTTATNTAALYPGAIIKLQDLRDIGDLNTIGGYERQPIQINSTLGDLRKVDDPSSRGNVDKMIKEIEGQGENFPANISYEVVEAYSLEQAMYSLGIDARYLGNSVSSKLSVEKEVERKSVFIKFFQVYHTVSISRPARAADFFGNSVTKEDLQEIITADNPLGYIEEVAYGRILVGKFTYTGTAFRSAIELETEVKKGLASGGGRYESENSELSRNSTFTVAILGGDAQEAAKVSGSGTDALRNAYDFLAEGGKDRSLGVPVQYKVRYLGNDQLFAVGGSAGFEAPECDMLNNHVTITNIRLTKFPPHKNKDDDTWDDIAVGDNKQPDIFPNIERYTGSGWKVEHNLRSGRIDNLTNDELPVDFKASYPIGRGSLKNDFKIVIWDDDSREFDVNEPKNERIGGIKFNLGKFLRTADNPQPEEAYPSTYTIGEGSSSVTLSLKWASKPQ